MSSHGDRRAFASMMLTAVLPLFTSTASAVDAPAVLPGPESLTSLNSYFDGTWVGNGAFTRNGKPLQTTTVYEGAADGDAILVRHSETPPNTSGYVGVISADAITRDFVMMTGTNGHGGARLLRSRGWQGDTIQFTTSPDLRAAFVLERNAITRVDTTHFHAKYEMSKDGVTWRTGDE